MRPHLRLLILAGVLVTAFAAPTRPAFAQGATLFQNVRVFDGKSDKVNAATNVLVEAGKITRIGSDIRAPQGAL